MRAKEATFMEMFDLLKSPLGFSNTHLEDPANYNSLAFIVNNVMKEAKEQGFLFIKVEY